MVDKIIYIYI